MTDIAAEYSALVEEQADNKAGIPFAHYKELYQKADPKLMEARSGLAFDDEGGYFSVRFIGRDVHVFWPSCEMAYADGEGQIPLNTRIFLARVLLECTLSSHTGKFLPYVDIGYGQTYLKAFNGRCIARFSFMFKSSKDFAACAKELGGNEVAEADAGFDFEIINGIYLRLLLWDGDDEFPMSGQILFSSNISATFSSEDACVMCDLILNELKATKKKLGI